MKLAYALDPIDVPIDLGLDLGALSVSTSGSEVSLSANAGMEFTFGIDLAPMPQFFVKDVSLTGSAMVAAPDIEAAARFGFLGVAVVGGSGAANASIAVGLHNPATADGRVTLADLFSGLSGDISSLVTINSVKLRLFGALIDAPCGVPAPAKRGILCAWGRGPFVGVGSCSAASSQS